MVLWSNNKVSMFWLGIEKGTKSSGVRVIFLTPVPTQTPPPPEMGKFLIIWSNNMLTGVWSYFYYEFA
jgi:hypothetical protein